MVALSVIAHAEGDGIEELLHCVFPGFAGIRPPGLVSAGKVAKNGAIVADLVRRDGTIIKDCVLFKSETEYRDAFRRLADEIKLNDASRIEMFAALRAWVLADRRLNPRMNPKDPDAKNQRYALH